MAASNFSTNPHAESDARRRVEARSGSASASRSNASAGGPGASAGAASHFGMDAERAAAAVATTDDGDGQKRCACGVWVPEGSCACPKCLAGRVTTRLRWHFREYPNATAWTLAREIGCAPSLAYRVRDQVLAERRG